MAMDSSTNHSRTQEDVQDDVALMRGIAQGDTAAMEHLYDRYSPRVFAFCLRSLRDRAESEDLVIEVFWELWNRCDRYDATRSSPWTYLMRVTRSRVVDRLRALRARGIATATHGTDGLSQNEPAATHEPADELAGRETESRLRQAMGLLTPEQRQALEMAYFDAMSYSEVADRLGQPLGTIKSRIRQALSLLRRALGGTNSDA